MRSRIRPYFCASFAAALVLAPSVTSCRHGGAREQALTNTDAEAPLPSSADRLGPNELAEGTEVAFGIPLPRDLRVERRFVDMVAASSKGWPAVRPDALTSYVERHVVGGTVELGPQRTVFRSVKARNGASNRELQVEISWDSGAVRLAVIDRTRPEIVPGLDETERWRRAGFDPSGRIIDPKQME